MDFLNKSLAQVSELFRSMTPGARITAGLLLAVVVVSLGYLLKQGAAGPDAFLFGGQALSDAELNRIEGALGQASLTWAREGNRIRVPVGQQAAAVAAVADADALPKNFNTILQDSLNQGGPFESNAEKVERFKIAKQQTLTEIIRAMDWVEEATVLYDEQQPRGLSTSKQVTGLVSVRPALGESLDPARAKMLQRLVARSVVGLKPEDVGVINLGDGGGYGSDGNMSFEIFEDEYYRTKIAFEMQQRDRILNHLRDIPGVRVEVNAELDATKEEMIRNLKPDKTTSTPSREVEVTEVSEQSTGKAGGQPGTTANGPNRQGATESPQQNLNKTNNTTTETDIVVSLEESKTLRKGFTPKAVLATVMIPASYIESIWRSRNPDAAAPPKPDDLKIIEDQVVPKIENLVEPLLLVQANRGQDTFKYVKVQVLDSLPAPTIEPPSTASQALAWTGRYWSTLAMLGVAMFSLMVLRSVVKAGPPSVGANAGLAGPTLSLQADNAPPRAYQQQEEAAEERPRLRLKKGTSLKDDLVEIVHEDPDAAAEILRSWIGKAS